MQDINVEDIGEGLPLVLVHGFLGSAEMWEPQINFFKKNFRVITPCLPGFGRSKNLKSLSDAYKTYTDEDDDATTDDFLKRYLQDYKA